MDASQIIEAYQALLLETEEKRVRDTITVSYTHLDVYKRQNLLGPGYVTLQY